MIRRGVVAVAVVCLVAGVACSREDAEAADVSTTVTPAAPGDGDVVTPRDMADGTGSGRGDGEFPRTVAHHAGETTIEAAPRRVVTLSTGQTDALLTLGIAPVGSTSGDGADRVPRYLYDAFGDRAPDLDAVADLGSRTEPNLEAIVAARPDLILVNSAGKNAATLYPQLTAIAPTVVTRGTGLYWKQDMLLAADATGSREAAQRWLDEYHADAAEVGAGMDARPTVSFLRRNGDRTRVFGVASFTGSVAEDAGLARPESQAFTDETSHDISAEQLGEADADHLFWAVQDGATTELTGLPLWASLGAVTSRRAVEVDDDVFYLNTGPTAARAVLDAVRAAVAD